MMNHPSCLFASYILVVGIIFTLAIALNDTIVWFFTLLLIILIFSFCLEYATQHYQWNLDSYQNNLLIYYSILDLSQQFLSNL